MISVKYPKSHGLDGNIHNIEILRVQNVKPYGDRNFHTIINGLEDGKQIIMEVVKDEESGKWFKVPHTALEYAKFNLCPIRKDVTDEVKRAIDGLEISNTEEKEYKFPKPRPAIEVFRDEHGNLYIMNAAATAIGLLGQEHKYDYPDNPTRRNLYPINRAMLNNLARHFEIVIRDIVLGLDNNNNKPSDSNKKPGVLDEETKRKIEKARINNRNDQLSIINALEARIRDIRSFKYLSILEDLNLRQYESYIYRMKEDPTSEVNLLLAKFVSFGLDDIMDKLRGVDRPNNNTRNSKALIANKLLRLSGISNYAEGMEVIRRLDCTLSEDYTWEDYEVAESILHSAVVASTTPFKHTREMHMELLTSDTISINGLGCKARIEDIAQKKRAKRQRL